jgi:hypothetical protein
MVYAMAQKAATKTEIPWPLPDALVERVAERFRVLGEPMRIRLLQVLREGEASVRELQEASGASQQNVSQHLGVLLRAGSSAAASRGTSRSTGSSTRSSSASATRCARGFAARSRSSMRCWREATEMYREATDIHHRSERSAQPNRWPLERVLFALAGTITLLSVALVALVSPWFLILTAFVGVNQWLYVTVGACPASLILKRVLGLRSAVYPVSGRADRARRSDPLVGERLGVMTEVGPSAGSVATRRPISGPS